MNDRVLCFCVNKDLAVLKVGGIRFDGAVCNNSVFCE